MTRALSIIAWLAGALLLTLATSALAGTPVQLRSQPTSGASITLGDLFDGAGAAGAVVVGNGAPAGLNAVLDAGAVARIAHANGLDWDNASEIRRIIVRSEATTAAERAPSGQAQTIEVLAYARSLTAGEIVQPQDLAYAKVPTFSAPQDLPRDADEIIGKVTRRPLQAGAPAQTRDVSAAQVIKRDDLVQVAYHADGISLTLQGKAVTAAAVGETLSVLNTSSKKLIQAVAVGPDQAVVGPEAEQIKAQVFPGRSLLAANR